VVVTGTRGAFWGRKDLVADDVTRQLGELEPAALLSGGEPTGVDAWAYGWGQTHVAPSHNVQMPADWVRYGKAAGFKRNQAMALRAAKARALGWTVVGQAWWNGESRGTLHMIAQLQCKGIEVEVHRSKDWEK
jgi:hypothetical protein